MSTRTTTPYPAVAREAAERRPDRWLGSGSAVLGVLLAVNSVLGPLVTGVITYPFTETVLNETLGLEAVTLALVAPLAVVAGVLTWRGHRAGPVLALGPASYAAYMLVQYVVGPQYPVYQLSIVWHLALFVVALAVLVRAWGTAEPGRLPRRTRAWAVVVLLLVAFVLSRWLPALAGVARQEPVPVAAPDLTMYWAIFLLDLGVVVPAAVATVVGLLRGAHWARRALFAVMGWFALVPPSVAAMAAVKVLRDDPVANPGDTVVLLVVALVVGLLAVTLYRPLFRSRTVRTQPPGGAVS